MAVEEKRAFHWAWVILGICFGILFINYSVRLGYGVVMPEMIRTLGFGRAASGTIYNAYLLVYITITPFTGYLTDRLGARRVITVCLLILGLGTFLMGTAQNLWKASLFFALTGLGASGIWTPVLTIVQRWFAHHRRGFAMGLVSTGYGVGFATMGAVFPWIVANFNWRYAWFFLGGMAFVMVFVSGIFLRSEPAGSGLMPWGQRHASKPNVNTPGTAKKRVPLSVIIQNHRFWIIGCSYFAITYSCYGITTFMVDYAKYQLGMPLEKAAFLATVHGIGQIFGVLTILPLSDYLGRKKTTIISNAFITASLIGILACGNAWGFLYALIACLGIFYGVTFPIYGLCAGDYFPQEAIGTVIGAWTPFYGGGAIMAHWVTGILRDMTGVYDQAFVIFIVTAAAGVLLMCLVKKAQDSSLGT
jgi:sugar phosphate permease